MIAVVMVLVVALMGFAWLLIETLDFSKWNSWFMVGIMPLLYVLYAVLTMFALVAVTN